MYVSCLRDLCQQIGIPTDVLHEEIVFFPGDTELAQAARTLQAIEKVKAQMSRLMNGLKIFLVLDDVWSHEDVQLFNFGEDMATSFTLFITTRTLDMFPSGGACWIDVPLLKPEDAVSFFFFESGRGEALPSDEEFIIATKLIQKCGFLPLAIRIAARMAKAHPDFLCQENDLEDIASTIGNIKDVSASNETIINILNRSFSFVTDANVSYGVKICFHNDVDICPWISKNIVEVLWSTLLKTSDDLRPYIRKLKAYRIEYMTDILHLLNIMGLVDKRNEKAGRGIQDESYQLQIHHDLLWEYGENIAVQYAKEKKDYSKSNHQTNDMDHFQEIQVEWNALIVEHYQDKIDSIAADDYISYDSHMLIWLPTHMMKARKIKEVINLLMNKSFFRDHVEFLGILEGTKQYASNIRALEKIKGINYTGNIQSISDRKMYIRTTVEDLLLMVTDCLWNMNNLILTENSKAEIGLALVFLGVTNQEFTIWDASLECFRKALEIFQKIGLNENHAYIMNTQNHIDSLSINSMVSLNYFEVVI